MKSIIYLFALILCSISSFAHPIIGVPTQTSIEMANYSGPIKRVIHRSVLSLYDIEIFEYNRFGMLTLEKYINDWNTYTKKYEYDEYNRQIKQTYEYLHYASGNLVKEIVKTSYFADKTIKKTYNIENELIREEICQYKFSRNGHIINESIYIVEYADNEIDKDTSYHDAQTYYRYKDNRLQYKVTYKGKDTKDSTCIEYDFNGKVVSELYYNGDKKVTLWNEDVKIKELIYNFGELRFVYNYDDIGREIVKDFYAHSACGECNDGVNKVVTKIETIYISDNKLIQRTYQEYHRQDEKSLLNYDCHMQLTEDCTYEISRDNFGNITKKTKIVDFHNDVIETNSYEYYEL